MSSILVSVGLEVSPADARHEIKPDKPACAIAGMQLWDK